MPVVRFNGKKLDPATIKALVAGTLVNGSKPSVWWNRQSIDFRNSFMDTIRTSMRNGESLTQAAARINGGIVDGVSVPGIMKTTKSRATALAATSMSAVTNEAALKTFQENNDVIKAITQVSTLDNKTSDICVAYSGQTWDVNTLQPVMGGSLPFNGGPPRHFNCRSRLRPVTMSFKELGIDKAEIPAGTRASMDGQVPADITFNQFLKKKGVAFQDELLGPARAQLYRNGDITLTQLVDMRGNPMTIAQLEARLGIKPKAIPKKAPKPSKKMVDSFLENDDGTFVKISQAEYSEIRGHARRLTAAADDADALVTQQIKGMADDVGAKFPDAAIVKDGPLVDEGSLHWRKKDLDSTSRKIQTYARDRNITYTEAADQISDSLRYTYIMDEDDYVKGIQEVMERFAQLGYKNNKFDPAWLLRPDYKGLNINMVSPTGVRMELQFHTAKSFHVKDQLNHVLYEKFRKLSKAKQVGPEGQALQAEMLANAQAIPVPKNIKFLEDLAKIYNKPNVAQQEKIFAQAKTRQLAAEKVAAEKAAIQTFNNQIASNLQTGDIEFARQLVTGAKEVSDAVKKSALKRIDDVEKKADKVADKILAKHKVADAKNRNDFNGKVADGLIDDLEDNPAARKLFIKKARLIKEANEEQWRVNDIRALLDAGDAQKAKDTLAGSDLSGKKKLKAIATEIVEGEKKTSHIIGKLKNAVDTDDVNNPVQWQKLVKQEINADYLPNWVRNDILNNNTFKILEQKVQYKPTYKMIDDMIVKGNLEDAKILLEDIPVNAPGRVTAATKVEQAEKNLRELTEKAIDKFATDAKILLKDEGVLSDVRSAIDVSLRSLGKAAKGSFGEAERAAIREIAQEFTALRSDAIAKIKAINKSSKGVNAIGEFVASLPDNLRTNVRFNAQVKKVTKLADKKAFNARNAVVDDMIEQGKLTVDDLDKYEDIVTASMQDVNKKLGKAQLKAKQAEIEAKIASAKNTEVSISEFAADPTKWDEEVRGYLLDSALKKLDDTVEIFIKEGAGSSAAKSNMIDLLVGKSAKQTRAIKEYVHSRVNPKTLPSGANFDAKVADIVTKHVNNKDKNVIKAHIEAMTKGADPSTVMHFEQTIMTRAGVTSIDDLGVTVKQMNAVDSIKTQLKVSDPGDVPIPVHTASERLKGAKHWLNAERLDDVEFKRQQLEQSKMMVRGGKGKIQEGDRLYGENSWGITPQEWQKWVDDVAPTLTEWDVALIHQYTGGMAGRINAGLYDGGLVENWTRGAQALNSALDKMPKHTGTVYRSTSSRQNWSADYIDARYEIGKTVTERGFGSSSTQTASQFNGNLKFIIKTNGKSGAIIGHVGQYGTSEMEVLFKAGTKFRVIKKKRNGGGITVWMEEI